MGDRGYDAEAIRQGLCGRRITPFLAKRNTEHGSGLGRWRWVIERTFAWLNQFRRLRVRYEKRADIHEAFLSLGCALICWRALRRKLGNPLKPSPRCIFRTGVRLIAFGAAPPASCVWPFPWELGSARTRSWPRSARAGWAKSTRLATRG